MGNRTSNDNIERESLAPSSNRPGSVSPSAIEAVTPFTPPAWPAPAGSAAAAAAAAAAATATSGSGGLAAQLNTTTFARSSASSTNNNTKGVPKSLSASTIIAIANNGLNNNNNSNKTTPSSSDGASAELPKPGTVARLKRFFSRGNITDDASQSTTPSPTSSSSWLPMPFASSPTNEEPPRYSSLGIRDM
jgi:hypothetical protein